MEQILLEENPNLKINVIGYLATNKYSSAYALKESGADIVLVALGMPAQEKLIYSHLEEFEKGIFVGVGGSFDVISGHKKRAPKIFIKLNM